MNMHADTPQRPEEEWQPPSFKAFASNVGTFVWSGGWLWRTCIVAAILCFLLFIYITRHWYQPLAIVVRIYWDTIFLTVLAIVVGRILLRKSSETKKTVVGFLTVAALIGIFWILSPVYRYVGQWNLYRNLNVVELNSMPSTDHERVLSLHAVHTLARMLRDQTELVSTPDFIRSSDGYCWSMAVQPDRWWWQVTAPVDEILCVPRDDANPDLSRRGQNPVSFVHGENLLYSRNTDNCSRRALGGWRYFNYEPGGVSYIERKPGEWIQVVSWVRWTGTWLLFFPRPEFGGVQIIEQDPNATRLKRWTVNWARDLFVGCGTWVRPQDIHKHDYLRGQNLMPDVVSRTMAESFRFQEGFVDPWEIFKAGDIRIGDLPGDVNKQPFTSFYRMPGTVEKLFDAFALEPKDLDKKTLHTSFFVPGDGIGPSYVYRHARRNEAPLGVTAVPSIIRESRPDVFWTDRRPDESRYFIRDLPDANGVVRRRLMYITTVVLVGAVEGGRGPSYTTGAAPLIAITDSQTRQVEWVDPQHPEGWDAAVQKRFGARWAGRR